MSVYHHIYESFPGSNVSNATPNRTQVLWFVTGEDRKLDPDPAPVEGKIPIRMILHLEDHPRMKQVVHNHACLLVPSNCPQDLCIFSDLPTFGLLLCKYVNATNPMQGFSEFIRANVTIQEFILQGLLYYQPGPKQCTIVREISQISHLHCLIHPKWAIQSYMLYSLQHSGYVFLCTLLTWKGIWSEYIWKGEAPEVAFGARSVEVCSWYFHGIFWHPNQFSGLVIQTLFCFGCGWPLPTKLVKKNRRGRLTPFLAISIVGGWMVESALWKDTPWKINMEPENHLFEKENHLPNLHFGFHVNFQLKVILFASFPQLAANISKTYTSEN